MEEAGGEGGRGGEEKWEKELKEIDVKFVRGEIKRT